MENFLESPETWVAFAFLIFIALVWKPAKNAMLSSLDTRGARIAKELSEAARLRDEAQALLAQYQSKHRDAMKEADNIIAHAKAEAERLAQQAARDLQASLKRREELAMQRIAQAEQQAADDVRAAAVDIAIAATGRLLKEKIDGTKGDALIEQAIKELPAKLH